jgi:hypothetical protein
MRTLALVLLAACSPDIVPNAYLCGPEALCPPGQVCDGVSDSCVLPAQAAPFMCDIGTEIPGDDSAGSANQISQLQCVSSRYSTYGCMPPGDAADWFKLSVPTECSAVEVQARIQFPVAYEHLAMELVDLGSNTSVGSDIECPKSLGDPAYIERCINLPVTPGHQYGVAIKSTADGACDGACAYNRYYLTVELATPG